MSQIVDGNFETARAVTQPFFSYPFEQNDSAMLSQEFEILATEYQRTPISAPHPDFPQMFLVSEETLNINFANILRFRRTYAEIPQSRSEWESYANRFAGLSSGNDQPEQFQVVAQSAGRPYDAVTAAAGFTAAVNDRLAIGWEYDTGVATFRGIINRVAAAVALPDVQFPSYRFEYWSGGQTISVVPTFTTITNISNSGRDPFTKVVQSEVKYDYFLPGVSAGITSHSDIPIVTTTEILDTTGYKTESYAPDSVPTRQDYEDQIRGQFMIVAESSTARRWKGEIFERATRYVLAE